MNRRSLFRLMTGTAVAGLYSLLEPNGCQGMLVPPTPKPRAGGNTLKQIMRTMKVQEVYVSGTSPRCGMYLKYTSPILGTVLGLGPIKCADFVAGGETLKEDALREVAMRMMAHPERWHKS